MTKLAWDATGEHYYETGVRNGVLYPQANDGSYPLGVAWNGLTSVSLNPTGADANAVWADDIKYLNLISREDLEGSIEAYTYPDEFKACNGEGTLITGVTAGQQARAPFGFCFRTVIGNDTQNESYGYKLHIVYGATASPSQKTYNTINDSPEAMSLSWDFKTVPVTVTYPAGMRPTALIEIDSTKVNSEKLEDLEDILYGTAESDPRLPLPTEVYTTLGGQTETVEEVHQGDQQQGDQQQGDQQSNGGSNGNP